jgi:hypothetical protein
MAPASPLQPGRHKVARALHDWPLAPSTAWQTAATPQRPGGRQCPRAAATPMSGWASTQSGPGEGWSCPPGKHASRRHSPGRTARRDATFAGVPVGQTPCTKRAVASTRSSPQARKRASSTAYGGAPAARTQKRPPQRRASRRVGQAAQGGAMPPRASVAQGPTATASARFCISAEPGYRAGSRNTPANGQRHRMGSVQAGADTARRQTGRADAAFTMQHRETGRGKAEESAAPRTAMGGMGARAGASILASPHASPDSCTDQPAEARHAGSAPKQALCSQLPTSSRKPKAGKRPTTTGNCDTDTAMRARRLKTVRGRHDQHQTVEEPCAGTLARTVLKQRGEERFSHRL